MRVTLFQATHGLSKELMPPLGLISLASYLRLHGYNDVEVHDLSRSEDQEKGLVEILENLSPGEQHCIGFNMNTHTRFAVQHLAEIARSIDPKAIVFAGGPHPTLDSVGVMEHCGAIDCVVRGEGEHTMLEALQVLDGEFSVNALQEVQGLSYRADGKIVHNAPRKRIADLDELPIPDRSLVDINAYDISFPVLDEKEQTGRQTTTMITSRGCPYGCVFCSVADQWGRKSTFRSIDKVLEELVYLKDVGGFSSIYFFDDTFTLNRRRVEDLCTRMIEQRLDLTWFCEIRANTVDEELLALMYRAGLRSVAMGLESASPRILGEIINKGIDVEQAIKAIESCRRLGIHAKVFFSYSYPTETVADVEETLAFIQRYRPDKPAFGRLRLYPGTPLMQLAQESGRISKEFSWFEWLDEYEGMANTMNVPFYVDKLTDNDFLFLSKRINDVLASYLNIGNPYWLKLKGLYLNLRRVRSMNDFLFVLKKVRLNLTGG